MIREGAGVQKNSKISDDNKVPLRNQFLLSIIAHIIIANKAIIQATTIQRPKE
ncbi:hypothetical protein HDF25_000548 [Pedobacter cryoconitis]|uniref:Uncharacterized protein n=1 Tax=Pedobacter cryoconitis TaxID=188932 RepID=A0A7X0MGT9_9SPHI|nr:hypothetical protein [Pedobacter cryoconitis]